MNESTQSERPMQDRVECVATKEPSVRVFVVAVLCIAFGLWNANDAFVNPKYSGVNHAFNVVAGVALPPLGLILLGYGVRMLRRRVVADAEGLGWVGKEKIAWGQITRLVVRGKELFDVHYEKDGASSVLKLDAWKMRNFAELVKLIESKTPGVPTETVKK